MLTVLLDTSTTRSSTASTIRDTVASSPWMYFRRADLTTVRRCPVRFWSFSTRSGRVRLLASFASCCSSRDFRFRGEAFGRFCPLDVVDRVAPSSLGRPTVVVDKKGKVGGGGEGFDRYYVPWTILFMCPSKTNSDDSSTNFSFVHVAYNLFDHDIIDRCSCRCSYTFGNIEPSSHIPRLCGCHDYVSDGFWS